MDTWKATVKRVRFGDVDDDMIEQAKNLLSAIQEGLFLHIEEFARPLKFPHYTLDFLRDNLPKMAAIK